jgi:uncharacterized Zn finger protein
MICPACGKNVDALVINRWKMGEYQLLKYRCPDCGSVWNEYENSKSLGPKKFLS